MRTRLGSTITGILLAAFLSVSNPGAAFADGPEEELARRYIPLVAVNEAATPCGPGEPFYPVAVEAVLGHLGTRLLGPNGEVLLAPPTADLANRGDGWHLDLVGDALDGGCEYPRWFEELRGPQFPPLVYAHVATEAGHAGEIALQYWMFWPFNDWNGRHEGDWELVQLTFAAPDAAAALELAPKSVTFSQHGGSETRAWSSTGIRREGDHVFVYPAIGSHAGYFAQERWLASNAATGLACDGTRAADTILGPEFILLLSRDYRAAPWLSFGGRWGEEHAAFNNGPRGPAFQQPWDAPISWMEDGSRPSVVMPWPDSFAADAFCGATRWVSHGYNHFLEFGRVPLAIAAMLGLLTAATILRTRSPRRRSLTWQPNRRTTAILLAAGLAATAWVSLLARTTSLGDLIEVAGPTHPMSSISMLLLGAPVTIPALAWSIRSRGWRAALAAGALGVLAGVTFGPVSGQPAVVNLVASIAAVAVLSLRMSRTGAATEPVAVRPRTRPDAI